MIMLGNKEITVFFSLLRSGLWHRPIDRLDCFPLTDTEWGQLYQYAEKQTVEGILFDGVQQLEAGMQPPKTLLLKWLVRVEKIRQRNRWMDTMLVEQALFFNKHNLHPILLKGQGVAQCYRDPTIRLSGDIDWYFDSPAAFAEANEQVHKLGLQLSSSGKYNSSYAWKGCAVDQHGKLFDIHNPFVQGYVGQLESAYGDNKLALLLGETRVSLLAPMLQILQVNTHILKHQLAFGVGIRQLCDAACLYAYYHRQVEGATLRAIYQKLNLLNWVHVFHQLLVDFLGLDRDKLPFELNKQQNCTWMMEDCWTAGNFGFHDENYIRQENGLFSGRKSTFKKIWANFWKYLPYAPMEAISFPIMHYRAKAD